MKEPYWLTREECLALHDMMLAQYGGCSGIRDEGLLESALARPQQLHHYGKPTMPEMAAAYSAGIVKNHPFLDGNKRTGFMMGAGFLERNGYEFFASEVEVVLRTLALAAGEMTEADYAAWLKENSKRV
ncbi:MAG: type II toxin-antitoxin system death-on-curing family toxin [Chthoniobacterales bacterium]|jgi:death-on-curing protein